MSAGYTAYSIPTTKLTAFPPGYNEDWLWCVLQRRDCGTRILKTSQLVLHKPSRLRQPTCDDVRFELRGDLILDSLVQCLASGSIGGLSTLRRLSGHTPDASVPAGRPRQGDPATGSRGGTSWTDAGRSLREHGLGVMEEMNPRLMRWR